MSTQLLATIIVVLLHDLMVRGDLIPKDTVLEVDREVRNDWKGSKLCRDATEEEIAEYRDESGAVAGIIDEKIQDLARQRGDLEDQIHDLGLNKAALTGEVADLEQSKETLAGELVALEQEKKDLAAEVDALKVAKKAAATK